MRSAARSSRRSAGSEGWGGGPGDGAGFFPAPQATGDAQATVLEVGEADHREERVVMEPRPRAALEMIEPQFSLELLVRQAGCPATQGVRPTASLAHASGR
jgi:hypothetical protein